MPFAQEPESGLKTAMLSGRAVYVIAPLHLGVSSGLYMVR
jgi:hypothetical protein